MAKITVQDTQITILQLEESDYISLTDMACAKEGDSRSADVIKNWIRNRYTIEFLGTWEVIHNPDFKVVEFDHFRKSAGLPPVFPIWKTSMHCSSTKASRKQNASQSSTK